VSRALFCLFATSTLAVGANLPAYLVIIKSTIQVCGRAFGQLWVLVLLF
jgi:replicative superfamily II helicase